jgi:hypothetical protein
MYFGHFRRPKKKHTLFSSLAGAAQPRDDSG